MDESAGFVEGILATLSAWWSEVVAYLPTLAAALAIVVLGWIVARIVRGSAHHVADYLNRILDRSLKRGALATARVPSAAFALVGEIAFWAVLLLAIAIAARVAGFGTVAIWLDRALDQLPSLVIGGIVVLVGYLVSARIGARIEAYPESETGRRRAFMARVAQLLVLVAAATIGLDQAGLDVTLLVVLIGVALGAASIGFSIAFGLGARSYAHAMIGARVARRELEAGMHVRIGDREGEVLEISATHLVLDTDAGKLLVPGGSALDEVILVHAPEHGEEREDA